MTDCCSCNGKKKKTWVGRTSRRVETVLRVKEDKKKKGCERIRTEDGKEEEMS